MPETICCAECETSLLGVQIGDSMPRPIGRDDCPVCGTSEFRTRDGSTSD